MNSKRTWIVLLIITLTKITSFSITTSTSINQDSTVYTITPEQIKYTNLIFVEHQKLLKENSLLNEQISNYQSLHNNFIKLDSIQKDQINNQLKINYDLCKEIDKKNKVIRIGGITVGISLILILLLK